MTADTSLILASASPRRRELLARLGVYFTVEPSSVEEPDPERVPNPDAYARELAEAKARDIAARYPDSTVLAADTIVVLEGRMLGKPADVDQARSTLESLRNRAHQVTTGVAVVNGNDLRAEHVTSDVVMRDYTDREISAYIESGDPFDKAGSYAIQDQTFRPVERLEGCYCNVVGLPLILAYRMLREAGVEVPELCETEFPNECQTCPLLVGQSTGVER